MPLRALVCLLLAMAPAWASYGDEDARLHDLYSHYLSPCCWRENLTVHSSPTADDLRARIKFLVDQGQTDDAIEKTLVGEYGARIMALPEGAPRVWLFWTPVALLAMGAAALIAMLRRAGTMRPAPAYEGPVAELDPGWDDD